ncbi:MULTISPECIES: hypothetical protein [Bacillus]|uniref:hypothetical protein n=1 Tax=Bacillus TaxID=1386 RepID=UPI001F094F01|nr:hypothetical protein [Bacillus mycoides]
MKIDTTLSIAVLVSSTITLLLFVLQHFIIEPSKEKKRKQIEKFKELYAPLYMMINAMLTSVILYERENGAERLYFTSAGSQGFINNDYMIEFVLKNSSYASVELLSELDIYICHATGGNLTSLEYENLTKIVVKEYQQLRRDLELKYDENELETGIPTSIRDIREIHSMKMSNH